MTLVFLSVFLLYVGGLALCVSLFIDIIMEFDMISKMKVGELKGFLHLRGLKVPGSKEELI